LIAITVKLTIGDNVQPLAGDWLLGLPALKKQAKSTGDARLNDYPSLLFNAMPTRFDYKLPPSVELLRYQSETNATNPCIPVPLRFR
jgi:hypothetical protein